MLIYAIQQSDSVIHTYVCVCVYMCVCVCIYMYVCVYIYTHTFFFKIFFSIMVYHRILSIVPCSIW